MVNGGILSIVGLYLIAVIYHGKTDEMMRLLSDSGGFLKWFGALWLLTVIIRMLGGQSGELARQLILVGLLGLTLDKGPQILGDVNKLFGDKENGR